MSDVCAFEPRLLPCVLPGPRTGGGTSGGSTFRPSSQAFTLACWWGHAAEGLLGAGALASCFGCLAGCHARRGARGLARRARIGQQLENLNTRNKDQENNQEAKCPDACERLPASAIPGAASCPCAGQCKRVPTLCPSPSLFFYMLYLASPFSLVDTSPRSIGRRMWRFAATPCHSIAPSPLSKPPVTYILRFFSY